MSANSKGSDETALMRSLVRAFAGCTCDKYLCPMCWLINGEGKTQKSNKTALSTKYMRSCFLLVNKVYMYN